MKIVQFITCITITFLCSRVSCQNVIVRGAANGNLPENFQSLGQYYYKDVNNYLDWFVGTWEYVHGNERFQISLTKITNHHTVIPDLDHNYYEDGIVLQYRKYVNNQLIFESPTYQTPNFYCTDSYNLEGNIQDYGRLSKSQYMPITNELLRQGGDPIYPFCTISKMPLDSNKVKFSLNDSYFYGYYDHEAYAGQPYYSIPNNIIMTRVD